MIATDQSLDREIPPATTGSFPNPPCDRENITDRRSNAWLLAGLAALAMLLFLRNPHVVVHPQFWHEDALVFFHDQRDAGMAALIKPYAGYLLIFHRVVAAFADMCPLEWTPLIYLVAAFAGWLAVGWLALTSKLFRGIRWAFIGALTWVAIPHGGEVFLRLTNVGWALGAGLALVLSEDPDIEHGKQRTTFAAIAAMSCPCSVVLAPLALWRCAIRWRTDRSLDGISIVVLAAATLQLFEICRASGRLNELGHVNLISLCWGFGVGVFPQLFGTSAHFPEDLPYRIFGTLVGLAGVGWAAGMRIPQCGARRRLLAAAGLMLGAGVLTCAATSGTMPSAFGDGQRYLFVPFALFAWALISVISHAPAKFEMRALPVILLLAIGIQSAKHFVSPRYDNADWPAVCRLVREGHDVVIHVAPLGASILITSDRTRSLAPTDSAPQRATQTDAKQ